MKERSSKYLVLSMGDRRGYATKDEAIKAASGALSASRRGVKFIVYEAVAVVAEPAIEPVITAYVGEEVSTEDED